MKKILLIIIAFFLSINIVIAKENKLSISSSDNKLYYDSKLLDTNTFMKHLDMIPGSTYIDDLVIENNTKYNFNLYLKIKNRNNNELLDYMTMKIYLDNKLIFDGDMLGSGLFNQNEELNNSYLLGNFTPKQISNLKVVTNFSFDYSNTNNTDSLIIDWKFFAETYDEIKDDEEVIVEVLPAPATGFSLDKMPLFIILISICIVGVLIVILFKVKRNGDNDE